jgi:hypothetical protein
MTTVATKAQVLVPSFEFLVSASSCSNQKVGTRN